MQTTTLRSLGCSLSLALITPLFAAPLAHGADATPAPAATAPALDPNVPVQMTAAQDHQRIMNLLGMTSLRPGARSPNGNTNEETANPFPNLPDPLVLKNGQKVTSPDMWWNQRRPEIVEDFDREVYGRVPAVTPKVTWEVTGTTEGMNGTIPTITKTLVGHVDNSSYPAITVNIGLTLTLPAKANGPSPVMLVFGGGGGGGGPRRGGGGGRGGAPGAPGAPAPGGFGAGGPAGQMAPAAAPAAGADQGAATAPGARRGGGGGGGFGGGAAWQLTALQKGWGYASLNTGSVQQDGGGGLTQGIIGLCNKGQPRKLDDWGVLRAWAWGASRALDYLETDKAVNAKAVGLEGHSRWGKATIVAMAYDQRFAIAYVSSSGEGGAKIHRRDKGENLENVAGTGEYHWMAGNFIKYAGPPLTRGDMPVDSHELVAMCAPRPVLITGGALNGDGWVDAQGMFMAASAAGPVYKLLGKKDLGTTVFPPIETALIDGDVAFRQHNGPHTDALNWPTFFIWAERYIKNPSLAAN